MTDNLRALRRHRPAIFERLAAAPNAAERYQLVSSRTGQLTISYRRPDGSTLCLSPNHDPLGSARAAMQQLAQPIGRGEILTLAGLGDGYLAATLAKHPPTLFLDMQQPVVIVEPDLELIRACLMFHDYTGDDSIFAQERFRFFVGIDWAEQLWSEWEGSGFMLPPSNITVRQGVDSLNIEKQLGRLTERLLKQDLASRVLIETHYASVDASRLAASFAEGDSLHCGRVAPPTVLLLTTRFSTVLQHVTRDTAAGFEQIGWRAKVLIEDHPWQRMTRLTLRRALAEYKPQLVFQLDHLRVEHGDLFPSNLPFACWIQDHLPNLMNAAAGKSVTPRDFILSNCGARYQREFGYPARQCIHLSKATHVPARPASWLRDGHDLVFVSNCSKTPAQIVAEIVNGMGQSPERPAVESACERILAHYAAGGSIELEADLRDLAPGVGTWFERLWHPLNDTLYRQQSIRWIVRVAARAGLKVSLFGNGWEKNPEFAAHSAGHARYGEELEAISRHAKFNFQIMPFSCLHQRLLDGLAAGGFYLIRDNLRNHLPYDLMRFVETHCGDATDTAGALGVVAADRRAPLEDLVSQYRRLNPNVDPVAQLRQLRDAGHLNMVPRLADVGFRSEAALEGLVRRYLDHPEEADGIAAEQRAWVEKHFAYPRHLRRVVGELGRLIASEQA